MPKPNQKYKREKQPERPLIDVRDSYTIEILPQQTDDDKEVKYKGSSVKGLLYMAMKKQKTAAMPFDEVWIVPDNDEENAFKLDENSLQRIHKSVPEHIYQNLKALQIKEMEVREVEQQNDEHLRICNRVFTKGVHFTK